jgi:autotransporter translocation and assembly factor TamB
LRKRYKIPLWIIGLIAVLVTAALFVLTQTDWLRNRASRELNNVLAERTDIQVEVGSLEGDLISGFRLTDVVVLARRQGVDTLAVIPRLSAAYDIRDFIRSRTIRRVQIESPRVFIPRDSISEYFASLIRTREGEASGSGKGFDFQIEELTLDGGRVSFQGGSEPVLDSVGLMLALQRHENTAAIELHQASAVSPAVGAISASGRFVHQNEEWAIDSLRVSTPRSRLLASLSGGRWQVQAQPFDFGDLRHILDLDIDGRIEFDGTVESQPSGGAVKGSGRIDGLLEDFRLDGVNATFSFTNNRLDFYAVDGQVNGSMCTGSGYLDFGASPEKYRYHGAVRHFDLNQWVEDTFDSDLSGDVELSGRGLRTSNLALDIGVRLGSGHFDHQVFDSAQGQMMVTADDLVLRDDFNLWRDHAQMMGGGRIGYRDSIDLIVNFNCSDLRPWDSLVFVDSLKGRASGYLYFSGATSDPVLTGRALSDSIQLYQIETRDFEGWFYAPSFFTRLSGHADVRIGPASVWGWDVDSLLLNLGLDGHVVTIDSAVVGSPDVIASGRGYLDWSADTIPVALYPLTLTWEQEEFAASDTARLVSDSGGIQIQTVAVESEMGHLRVGGRYGFDGTLDLQFSIGGVRIGPTWKRFIPDVDLDGQLACTGTIGGTTATPYVTLEGDIKVLTYEELLLGNLSGKVTYANHMLRAERLRLKHRDYDVAVNGSLPLEFSIVPPVFTVPEKPLTGHLSATGEALEVASYLLPDVIEYVRGPFSISATLGGTPRVPQVTGDAYLRNGEVKTVEIANPIENLQVDLALKQDTIEIKRAVGTIREKKKTGSISAKGKLRILGYTEFDYEIGIEGRKVPARFEFEDYYVETDFDLTVTGVTPPVVRGEIRPSRVEDRTAFDEEPAEVVEDPNLWDWDLTVSLPGNYWIHNDQIDAELSADLRLLRENGRLTYLGTAEIIRGKVYLFDKVGDIKRGILTFDDVNKPDPSLDIDVGFRIRQARPDQALPGESTQAIELDLHVGGRASEPLIQPQAPYTEQDVLLLLAANMSAAGGDPLSEGDPWGNRLRFAATGLLFSEVQKIAARTLGLQTLEIDASGNPADAQITVGRYFSPHLYLYGTSPLDAGVGQEYGFEYRLNRRLYLEGNRDKQNLYRLNIHFNWDY